MAIAPSSIGSMDLRIGKSENRARAGDVLLQQASPDERSDIRGFHLLEPRISRSLSSGAHSRDPVAHAGYVLLAQRVGRTSG